MTPWGRTSVENITPVEDWRLTLTDDKAQPPCASASGLGLEPLDELAHLGVRRLDVGEPPRMAERLAWTVLLALVGDQRGERVAVIGMTGEHSLEHLDRLFRRPVPPSPTAYTYP